MKFHVLKNSIGFRRWSHEKLSPYAQRSYEIITVNYICVRHKIMQKHNKHFTLLFFKINLHFGTSDHISTYGKLNLLPINSIFLVFPSRERQRTLMQTKVYYKLSLFSLKRSVSQTFKSSSCKKSLFQACLLLIQLASMNYFRSMW